MVEDGETVDTSRTANSISVTIRFRPLSEREFQRGDEVAWYADGDKIVKNACNRSTAYAFERKRKKQDGKEIKSSKKTMPHKGPPIKKAKEVTYYTSTQTYKVGGCASTKEIKGADASGEKARPSEEAASETQQPANIDLISQR